jgi:hypothetical protein
LPAPSGSFVLAEVRAVETAYPSWTKPVRAFFRRTNEGWKLVGLERMGENEPAISTGR